MLYNKLQPTQCDYNLSSRDNSSTLCNSLRFIISNIFLVTFVIAGIYTATACVDEMSEYELKVSKIERHEFCLLHSLNNLIAITLHIWRNPLFKAEQRESPVIAFPVADYISVGLMALNSFRLLRFSTVRDKDVAACKLISNNYTLCAVAMQGRQ